MNQVPRPATRWLLVLVVAFITALSPAIAAAEPSTPGEAPMVSLGSETFGDDPASTPLGSGDGRIHVIPSLHPYSIKDGEKLTLSALVRSERPVASVVADLGGMAEVTLEPNTRAGLGQMATGESVAVYSGEWTGEGLEELVYAVTLTITDIDGHSWTDHSLTFSDPAAGNSTVGSTAYPPQRKGSAILNPEGTLRSAVIDLSTGHAFFGTSVPSPQF